MTPIDAPQPTLDALGAIARERHRQLDAGFTPDYDDARGGVAYLTALAARYCTDAIATDALGHNARARRRLIHAAATIVAAIEAMDTSTPVDATQPPTPSNPS